MEYNIWLTFCAAITIIVLLILYHLRNSIKIAQNTVFQTIMYVSLAGCIISIFAYKLSGNFDYVLHVRTLKHLEMACSVAVGGLWLLYLFVILDFKVHFKKLLISIVIPIAAITIICFVNNFTHTFFYLDQTTAYHVNTQYYPYIYLIFVYLAVIGTWLYFKYHKQLALVRLVLFPVLIIIYAASYVFQQFFPQIIVHHFAAALCISIAYFDMQNPSEFFDSETGLYNETTFAIFTQKRIHDNKPIFFLGLCVPYIDMIQSITGMTPKEVTDRIFNTIRKKYNNQIQIYRIRSDRFLIIPDGYSHSKIQDISDILGKDIEQFDEQVDSMALSTTRFIFEYPRNVKDIQDISNIMHIGGKLGRSKGYTVIDIADILKDNTVNMTEMVKKIQYALKNDLLEVYLQPIYSPSEGKYTSAEALIRMHDMDGSIISPVKFIPVAEKSALISDIDSYVLDTVCRLMSESDILSKGIEYIEVNLSISECIQADLPERIMRCLDKYSLPASRLNLEITETINSESTKLLDINIDRLHKMGINFSLDDYGTGYSSLERLLNIPFSIIKLDKSIVQPPFMSDDPSSRTLLNCSANIAKLTNAEIVAEGVETLEMVEGLKELGIDHIQGFYYSKPLPIPQFIEFINDNYKA